MSLTHPASRFSRRDWWWGVLGLGLAVLIAYSNSFQGPFVFDDVEAVVENSSIRHLGSLGTVLAPQAHGGVTVGGRPMVNLSFALNYAMGGESVTGYHVTNLFIHGLAGLVLFGIIRRTLLKLSPASRYSQASLPLALAVAGLWLLHPLQTESVTYIVQRAESLMGLLYLLTLYAFIRSVEAGASVTAWRVVSFVACLAGMATKEVMVSVPLVVFLYDRTFIAGSFGEAWRSRWKYYLSLTATWLLLAGLVASTAGRGGTAGLGTEISSLDYLLTQCQALIHYLWLAFWPSPLVFDYGTAAVSNPVEVWWQVLLLIGLFGATLWALARRPVWGFLGICFFAILAPSSSVVPVASQTMAEHRMYLPLAVVLVVVVLGLFAWVGRCAWIIYALLAVVCGGLTFARNRDYRSERQLWTDTVAKRPENSRAHNNLGKTIFDSGNASEAIPHLDEAIRRDPIAAEPRYNLALALAKLGRGPQAITSYEEALRLQPNYADAHNGLGTALLKRGRVAEALGHYERAAQLRADSADFQSNLASALLEAGRVTESLQRAQEAVRLDPRHADARYNLGNVLAHSRRVAAALPHYQEAVRLKPADANFRNNLANVLVELDRLPDALVHYEEALRLQPSLVEPRRNLAIVLANLGRLSEAVAQLQILLQAHPDDAQAREMLTQLRAAMR